ncbi:MAG: AI-2E family transporter [Armatimonadota bacterium]
MPDRFAGYMKLVLLAVGLLVLLYFAASVVRFLLLFLLILVLAMMLTPPVSWLERHRIRRSIGAPLLVLLVLGLLVGLGFWLLPPLFEQVTAFIEAIPAYWARLQAWATTTLAEYPRVRELLATNQRLISSAAGYLEAVLLQAGQVTIGLFTGFATAVLVFLLTMFVLIQPRPLLVGLLAMVPPARQEAVARAVHTIAQQMRIYLVSSLIIGTVNGVIVYFVLTLLGVQPALVLAMLTLIGEFFPYIGPIAAAIPALILAFLVSPLTALWVLLLYLAIQQLEASVLSPLILSRQMKFHPLSVAFAILTLGSLFGILGAFLAVPVLSILKALYEELVLKPREPDRQQLERYADLVVESRKPKKQEAAE